MKLYRAKIPAIAQELLSRLVADGDIEVTDRQEAEQDIQSVLKEYLRLEREITDQAKDLIAARKLQQSQFNRVKRSLAEQRGFGAGDEGLRWMCDQIIETFMQSAFVEEIFSSDVDIRRKMSEILRRHMLVDEEVDREVRDRIKNLQEGSAQWEVEYGRVIEQIKRKRGLDKG